MNTLLFLRKSAPPLSRRVTVAALTTSVEAILRQHNSPTGEQLLPRNALSTTQLHNFTTATGFDKASPTFGSNLPEWFNVQSGVVRRGLHVGAGSPLNFQSSTLADVSDDYKTTPSDIEIGSGGPPCSEDGLLIENLGISQDIVSALARKGITKLFPIQQAVLQPAMQGRDMIGRARTGTGKTLAFGIPIMDKIIRFNVEHGQGRNPLALILAPTRELARQVDKEFYESAPKLDTICVYGGVPIQRQMSTLDRGVDVVVGTPGRIIDLIRRGALNLSEVQFVVLDEADQMLNVGFAEDVEVILKNLPKNRQSMMFSATMPSWIINLTHKYLKNPLTIDLVGDSNQKLADGISLYSIASTKHQRPSILGPLITEHAKGGKCIVFTQTKRDADLLAYAMQKSFRCEALHGDISQNQRERTLKGFRDGLFNVLVATDVAARGLDVPNVDLVVHYELPNTSEIFVHRSGRTGRAGKKGSAILIYSSDQLRDVRGIEREVGCKFTELPEISVEGGKGVFFSGLGSRGSRFGSYGSSGGSQLDDAGFGRSGGSRYNDSGFSRSRASRFNDSGFGRFGSNQSDDSGFGRSGGFGSPANSHSGSYNGSSSGRSSGFGERNPGRVGSYGGRSSSSSGGFGGGPTFNRSHGFGGKGLDRSVFGGLSGSDHVSGFGSKGASGSFGGSGPDRSGFGGLSGSDRVSGFGDQDASGFSYRLDSGKD